MAYYVMPPVLRTRVIQLTRPAGPMLQTRGIVLSTPGWLGAQQRTTPVEAVKLWNRIPVALAEGVEPTPQWDIMPAGF